MSGMAMTVGVARAVALSDSAIDYVSIGWLVWVVVTVEAVLYMCQTFCWSSEPWSDKSRRHGVQWKTSTASAGA